MIDFDFIGEGTYISYRLPVGGDPRRDIHRIWDGRVVAVYPRTQIVRVALSHFDYEGFEEYVHISQIIATSDDVLALLQMTGR